MKFSIAAVFAFAAMAFAYPKAANEGVDYEALAKRQDIVNSDPSVPSMTDASGNVVPFDSNQVQQAATNNGL